MSKMSKTSKNKISSVFNVVEQTGGNIQSSLQLPFKIENDTGFQCVKWFFTYHWKPDEQKLDDIFNNLKLLSGECSKWVFAEEYGKEGKTPHIQGGFILKKKKRSGFLQNFFEGRSASLFKMKGKWPKVIDYCNKENGRKMCSEKLPTKLVDYFDLSKTTWWQKQILDIAKLPSSHNRDIYWFYDEMGRNGKTTLGRHLVMNYNCLLVGGKGSDIKFAFAKHLEKHKGACDIVVVNIPKLSKSVPYSTLEELKDGIFFSGKYESGQCVFNIPHVFVFANFPPKSTMNGRIHSFDLDAGEPLSD